jgi:Notch-like protein
VVSGTSCVKKTCDTAAASTDFDLDSECSAYVSTCTVARIGGC